MLVPVFLCLFVTAANCFDNGWKVGTLYEYDLDACISLVNDTNPVNMTETSFVSANLHIQPVSNNELSVTFQNTKESEFNDATKTDRCATLVPAEQNLESNTFLDNETFTIHFIKGVVTGITLNSNLAEDDDDNFLILFQAIAIQLQLNLHGKNCPGPKPCKLPTETKPEVSYRFKENSGTGMCPIQYKVSRKAENKPTPGLENEQSFEVAKSVNFVRCLIGLPDSEFANRTEKLVADTAGTFTYVNNMVVAGKEDHYTIQSTVGRHVMDIKSPEDPTEKFNLKMATSLTMTSAHPATGSAPSVKNPTDSSVTITE